MSTPKRRRWLSMSLRSLLIGVTLASLLCAWFPYRQQRIAEMERLEALNVDGLVSLGFVDSVWGWELPQAEVTGWMVSRPGTAGAVGGTKGVLDFSPSATYFGGEPVYDDSHRMLRAVSVPLLRSVDVTHWGGTNDEDLPPLWLADALAVDGLRELEFCAEHAAMVKFLARFRPRVETLKIRYASAAALEPLSSWPTIKHVFVDSSDVDDALLFAIVSQFPNLESLELGAGYGNSSTSFTPQGIAALSNLRSLTRLRLDECHLQRQHVEQIAGLQQLKELSLQENQLKSACIQPLKQLPRLRMINLDGNDDVPAAEFKQIRGDWRPPTPPRPFVTGPIPVVGQS